MQKYLHNWENCCNFARFFEKKGINATKLRCLHAALVVIV